MANIPEEPLLLTPGPITTSRATKEAMLRDLGEEGTGEGDDVSLHSSYAS